MEHLCASEFGKEGCWGDGGASLWGTRAVWLLCGPDPGPLCFPACPRAVWPAVWPRCLRAAAVLPRGKRASRCQCRCAEAAAGTGRDWTCPGHVRDVSSSCSQAHPGTGTARVGTAESWRQYLHSCITLAAVLSISRPPGDMPHGDEAPTRRITCRSSGAAGGEAPLRAENQMVLVWRLGLGQKWQCLFFGELGGARNLSLVFPCSCVLAGMMCSMDSYSACSHEGAKQLPPSPRLLVPLGFFLVELCCSCQV